MNSCKDRRGIFLIFLIFLVRLDFVLLVETATSRTQPSLVTHVLISHLHTFSLSLSLSDTLILTLILT